VRRFLFITLSLCLVLTALSACGGPSAHDFTYVTPDGDEYTGTYTGGWEGGQPNGEGEFSGKGERGTVSLVGNWSNGQPNGQCRYIFETDTYIGTYNGDYFYGERQGNGNAKFEDLDGNLLKTYTGSFQSNQYSGSSEMTYYYTEEEAAEYGYDRKIYKGQFANNDWSGAGELTFYCTAEYAASCGVERISLSGQYSDGWTGEVEQTFYFTSEYADQYQLDTEVHAGQCIDGTLVEPYRYALYLSGKEIEKGRIKDGKYISDAEKALNDSIYDGLRSLAGDGILGDLYDIFAPSIYDRNAD